MGNLPFSSYGGPQFCGPSCISRSFFDEHTGDFEDDMQNPGKGMKAGCDGQEARVYFPLVN